MNERYDDNKTLSNRIYLIVLLEQTLLMLKIYARFPKNHWSQM